MSEQEQPTPQVTWNVSLNLPTGWELSWMKRKLSNG